MALRNGRVLTGKDCMVYCPMFICTAMVATCACGAYVTFSSPDSDSYYRVQKLHRTDMSGNVHRLDWAFHGK